MKNFGYLCIFIIIIGVMGFLLGLPCYILGKESGMMEYCVRTNTSEEMSVKDYNKAVELCKATRDENE